MTSIIRSCLLSVVLLPVGAGSEVDHGGSFRVVTDEVPFYYKSCDGNGNCKEINRNGTVQLTCYTKMRQAMRVMNEAIEKNLDNKRGSFYDMMIIAIYDKDRQQWDHTMRECVEGRP